MNIVQMAQTETSFRTTTPSTLTTTATTAKQVDPVHVHKNTSGVDLQHTVDMSTSLQFRSVNQMNCQAPTQWKDFSEQTPTDKARHSVTLFLLL